MIRRVAVLILVVACSSEARDDCKLVLDDPAQAMARVTNRYPGDPVNVAQTIERCVAPTGDECERLDKIVHAIPSMMGSAAQLSTSSLEICRRMMTPEMRRCMLPSYTLAHQDECAQLRGQMAATSVTQLPIAPSTRQNTEAACDVPALAIERGSMTLVSGPLAHRVTTRHDGSPDVAWLEARLTAEKTAHPECGAVEITAGRSVRYRDVITAMDVAVKDELVIGTSHIASVAEVAAGADLIEPLAPALPPTVDHMAILQADEATDMIVIARAVRTLKRGGYNNVMFAVKKK